MNPRGCICIGNKPKREKCKMIVQGHKKEKGHDKVKHRICKEQNWKIWSFCWSYSRIAWIALKEREKKRKNSHASIIDMNSYPFPRHHRRRCNEREANCLNGQQPGVEMENIKRGLQVVHSLAFNRATAACWARKPPTSLLSRKFSFFNRPISSRAPVN